MTSAESNKLSYDIFISHAGDDKPKAMELCQTLEAKGLRCWIAPRDVEAGKSYLEAILDGVVNSKTLLLLLSENTKHSDYVVNEVERAKSYKKTIFTVRLDDVSVPPALELILSAPQWIDSWATDYPERLHQIVTIIREGRVSTGLPPPPKVSSFTKLFRMTKGNIIGLVTMSILLFIVLKFFVFQQDYTPPDGHDALNDLSTADFSIRIDKGISFNSTLSMTLFPKSNELASSIELLSQQVNVIFTFDNGIELSDIGSLMRISVDLPDMQTIPSFVTVIIEDFDGNRSPPLQFELKQLKAMIERSEQQDNGAQVDRLIALMASGSHYYCSSVDGFVGRIQECHLGGITQRLSLQDVKLSVKQISVGDSAQTLSHSIDIDTMTADGDIGVEALSAENRFAFFLPMTSDQMYMQLTFVNGEQSPRTKIHTPPLNESSVVNQLRSKDKAAPQLMMSLSTAMNQGALAVNLSAEIPAASWYFFEGVEQAFTKRGSYFIYPITNLREFMQNPPVITIAFDDNGLAQTYAYTTQINAAIDDIALSALKNKISTQFACGEQYCAFDWLSTQQHDLDKIKDIMVGLASDDLYSVSNGDFTDLNAQINARRLALLEQAQSSAQSTPSSTLSFGTPVNAQTPPSLAERLSSPDVFSSSSEWNIIKDKRKAIFISYTFPPERLFFQVIWVDNTKSDIIVKNLPAMQ